MNSSFPKTRCRSAAFGVCGARWLRVATIPVKRQRHGTGATVVRAVAGAGGGDRDRALPLLADDPAVRGRVVVGRGAGDCGAAGAGAAATVGILVPRQP